MPTGFLVLLFVALGCAILVHWRIRRFWLACLASAPLTAGLFLAVSSVQSGFPDPFKPVALVYFAGFGFLVSLQVGAAFVLLRHRQKERTRASQVA